MTLARAAGRGVAAAEVSGGDASPGYCGRGLHVPVHISQETAETQANKGE